MIYFYVRASDRVRPEHVFLNNFHHSPIVVNGLLFQTTEHYFQACKFIDSPYFETVRRAPTPLKAKRLASKVKIDGKSWDQRRDSVMMEALRAKFTQHEDLKMQLLNTGNARLIEDSNTDMYWGGSLPDSQNRLGELLMTLRQEIREQNM